MNLTDTGQLRELVRHVGKDERNEGNSQNDDEHSEGLLELVDRHDVAIAHSGAGDGGPVERGEVLVDAFRIAQPLVSDPVVGTVQREGSTSDLQARQQVQYKHEGQYGLEDALVLEAEGRAFEEPGNEDSEFADAHEFSTHEDFVESGKSIETEVEEVLEVVLGAWRLGLSENGEWQTGKQVEEEAALDVALSDELVVGDDLAFLLRTEGAEELHCDIGYKNDVHKHIHCH